MDPNIWGPKLWFVIHTFALNYPDNPTYEDKRIMEEFFNNLKYSIPCSKCKIHYKQRLEKAPIINFLENKQSLFKFTIDLHNQVNKSLGKKIYSYDEVVQIYKEHYNPTLVKKESFWAFLKKWVNLKYLGIATLVLVLLIVAVIYIRKKYPKRLIRV